MNREALYEEWQKKTWNRQALCDTKTINKFRKISDPNFEYYMQYQNSLFSKEEAINVFKNRRSKVVDFLVFISDCDLKDITQNEVDGYFKKFETEAPSTNNSRVSFLKNFLEFFSLENKVDVEQHKKPTDKSRKKMTRISAQQISEIRENYKDDTIKRFIFEMMYYTTLSMDEIGRFKIDYFHPENNTISYGKKENKIPKSLAALIQKMHATGEFNNLRDPKSIIDKMKKELKKRGVANLTSTDGNETRKTTFWKCPQCGEEYEAIAENWCVKQYTDNGENWVVCRERCANE